MAEYRVLFRAEAESQIRDAYDWDISFWGETEAGRWLRELYDSIFNRLTSFPQSCPIAPESTETDSEVRQYVIGHRYRVLFAIEGKTVIVLQFRGPFTTTSLDELGGR